MRLHERLASLILLAALAAGLPQPAAAEPAATFSDAEIESLLAPVALYPDTLLTQILIAATYPLEVVEAARFVAAHPELEGSDAVLAAAAFDWDPSIQALTAFPEVLERMNADLRWTRDLGEAFLQQQDDVMVSLQTLRQRARLAGTLDGVEHLQLETQGERLVLNPPREDLVYVPWYDSSSAYGQWPSQQHQPVYWEPHPRTLNTYQTARMSRSALFFGPAIHLDPLYYPTRIDWHRRGVVVVDRSQGRPWQHDRQDRRSLRRQDAQRHWERDRHRPRPGQRGWPEQPTASLSQQRAGAIDTRSASERLRALQAEAAAASAAGERQPTTRRFAGQTAPQREPSAAGRRSERDAATTLMRQQRESNPRSEAPGQVQRRASPRSTAQAGGAHRERSRAGNERQPIRTTRDFGGNPPRASRQSPPGAGTQQSAPTTRQFARPQAPPRRPD